MNLSDILTTVSREIPKKPALVSGAERISYGELDELSNRVANLLIEEGLGNGEHAAILMSHCPGWVASLFGIFKAGGVAVLLSTALKTPELGSLLRDSDSKILITESHFARALSPVLPGLPRLKQVLETDTGAYRTRVAASSSLRPGIEISDDDRATIFYTSGVLGRQKGVVHTHASLLGTPEIVSAGIGRGRDDVVIDPVPFFYLLGLSEVMFGSVIKGATVVIVPQFTPRAILEAIEREKGTILYGVPAMHNALAMLREDVIRAHDIKSLRVASTAGAKTSPYLMKMLEDKLDITLCETYGLSELSVVSMSTIHNHRLGTVGKPLGPIRVLDDNGCEVATGEIGEAVFQIPWAMQAYYKAPDLTAQVFRDGWFYTGDSVKMDAEGYLEYVEKKSFIIVTPAGLKISPWEVESLLLQYPGVAEAAYVGVKASRNGVVPTAYIVPKEGQKVTADELARYCYENLADFKAPKRFEFVDCIPKTGSGKIDRRVLQEG